MQKNLPQLSVPLWEQELFASLKKNTQAVHETTNTDQLITVSKSLVYNDDFDSEDELFLVAQRAVRLCLNEFAIHGASSLSYRINLYIPPSMMSKTRLSAFINGIHHDQNLYALSFESGSIVPTFEDFIIHISFLGQKIETLSSNNEGIKSGDKIYMVGHMGKAAIGYAFKNKLIQEVRDQDLIQNTEDTFLPETNLELGKWIATLKSSSVAINNNLQDDLQSLCQVSEVCAHVMKKQLPWDDKFIQVYQQCSDQSKSILQNLATTTSGDGNVVFSIAPGNCHEIDFLQKKYITPITHIGYFVQCGEKIPQVVFIA